MVLAGVTLLIILAVYRMFRGFVATIAVLIGLVLGTVIGVIFDYTDFSGVGSAHWFGVDYAIPLRRADLQGRRNHLDDRRHVDHRGRDDR